VGNVTKGGGKRSKRRDLNKMGKTVKQVRMTTESEEETPSQNESGFIASETEPKVLRLGLDDDTNHEGSEVQPPRKKKRTGIMEASA